MSWNTLTVETVQGQMSPAEVAALENIQGNSTEAQAILTTAINAARSSIKAGGNQVDQSATTTLPDAVVQSVIDIVRWKWLCSFLALKAFKTEDREKASIAAEKRFTNIASADPKRERTELPATADTTPIPVNGAQVASNTRRKATAHKLSGLI